MKRFKSVWFLGVAVMFVAIGCAGTQEAKFTPLQKLGAPEWVIKGSGAFGGDRGKAFYGVASASNIQNMGLLRSAADNRARNEIAKTIQVYTASLMKDYAASTVGGQGTTSSEEQHVEQAVKTVTSATLSGVEVIDHWQNPETGELYSLAKLDLQAFKDNASKAKELSARAKEYIKQNAEKVHDQLEKEEEKMKGSEK